MYAVLKTGGKQYRVEPGQVLRVEKLEAGEGETVRFDQILMVGGEAETAVGAPLVAGAAVEAEVLAQVKADKVISFVRRRRKHSSKRTRGHRQRLTVVRVTGIQPADGAEMIRAAEEEAEAAPETVETTEGLDPAVLATPMGAVAAGTAVAAGAAAVLETGAAVAETTAEALDPGAGSDAGPDAGDEATDAAETKAPRATETEE